MPKAHDICAMTVEQGIDNVKSSRMAAHTGNPSSQEAGDPSQADTPEDKLAYTVRLFFEVEILNFLKPGENNLNSI